MGASIVPNPEGRIFQSFLMGQKIASHSGYPIYLHKLIVKYRRG